MSSADEVDRGLIRATLDGDPEAFGTLIDRHQRVLFNLALRMVANYDDAADVVQNALIKAYRRLHTFDDRYRFFSWIYRIVMNEAVNMLNRRKPTVEVSPDLPFPGPSGDEEVNELEMRTQIQAALMQLTPNYRQVIVLRHFADLSYREISDLLDVPEKTVKSRLFTARQTLGDLLLRQGAVERP
jgi:RNA polymerase sigma-70 factor (ECF subfamily)